MQRNRKPLFVLFMGLFLTLCTAPHIAQAQDRFADAVLRYEPLFTGGPAPSAVNQNSLQALGAPGGGFVSLGRGGLLELAFLNNLLTNSATNAADLYIYEIGPDIEDTFVAIRPTGTTFTLLGPSFDTNGDGFLEIGKVFGSTSTIDIDAIFPGFAAGTLQFNAVQLIDDRLEGNSTGVSVGADIDALEALTSVPVVTGPIPVPEPSEWLAMGMAGTSVLGLMIRARRRKNSPAAA
ncbi:MAG: PEP-CTERM sorting domain-containing protein [Armatimonadota bacterium]